ncbi:MAG TPA: hypothetical protein VK772_07610, partial [Puia sp.]|nr:hypothetical protein [Puia sp.]
VLAWIIIYVIRISKKHLQKKKDNPYAGIRNMALQTTPGQMGLNPDADPSTVYGMVMDWPMSKGIITLVCFNTGDASMYTSTGGGMIGGVTQDAIKKTAVEFVHNAQDFLKLAVKIDTVELPDAGTLQFCFLTPSGIFIARESFSQIENDNSALLPLFVQANEVITALRTTKA